MFSHAVLTIVLAALLSQAVKTQSDDFTINPATIPLPTRNGWCSVQQATCIALCDAATEWSDCSASTLIWNCSCQNYPTPDINSYLSTIPSLTCHQLYVNCNKTAASDQAGLTDCFNNFDGKCGSLAASAFKPTTTYATPSTLPADVASSISSTSPSAASTTSILTSSSSSTRASAPSASTRASVKGIDNTPTSFETLLRPTSAGTSISAGASTSAITAPATGYKTGVRIGIAFGILGGVIFAGLICTYFATRQLAKRAEEVERLKHSSKGQDSFLEWKHKDENGGGGNLQSTVLEMDEQPGQKQKAPTVTELPGLVEGRCELD